MYHDQCQIANKLLEFERGIAIHDGSPVPTVTTGHGTAYDIVGPGKANPIPLNGPYQSRETSPGTAQCIRPAVSG